MEVLQWTSKLLKIRIKDTKKQISLLMTEGAWKIKNQVYRNMRPYLQLKRNWELLMMESRNFLPHLRPEESCQTIKGDTPYISNKIKLTLTVLYFYPSRQHYFCIKVKSIVSFHIINFQGTWIQEIRKFKVLISKLNLTSQASKRMWNYATIDTIWERQRTEYQS